MLNQNELTNLINQIISKKKLRIDATTKSHFLFFHMYLADYVGYETAPFQKEIFDLTQDEEQKFAVICAFRGSAKSTIMSLSYPLWAVMGQQQKKHVVIASKTQTMAKRILDNLKRELIENDLLKADMGPFRSVGGKWGGDSIELTKHKARITVVSTEEGVRGIRHGKYRPDLIICDDIEDLNSVNTQDGRNRIYGWFNGELMPAGDKRTRYIIIGNLLHSDSFIMRLKKEIVEEKRDGAFKFYPLIDDQGNCLWPGKYSTQAEIEAEKRNLADEIAWSREYLLKIISDAERVVRPETIQYWDRLPDCRNVEYAVVAIDLAIKETETADCTAMIIGLIYGRGKDMKIYILGDMVNAKMEFDRSIEKAKELYFSLANNGYVTKLWAENVGYQDAFVQELKNQGVEAEGFQPTTNKRGRLMMTTQKIKLGQVLFPPKGAETLINQLIGFGKERYDDLADAFAILVIKAMIQNTLPNDPIAVNWDFRNNSSSPSSGQGHSRRKGTLRYDMDNSDPLGWGEASTRY